MVQQQSNSDLEFRLTVAERRLKLFQVFYGAAMAVFVSGVIYLALQPHFHNGYSSDVLRVRGVIVEDAAGRERILIGAPVPIVTGRKRRDDTVGLIVVGENGADRLVLAAPAPEPQIEGAIGKRYGRATGFILDDENGNERGGFAVLDNDGRVSLGLDYPNGAGQAIGPGVLPGETSINIQDSKSIVRASLLERNDSAPIIYGLNLQNPPTIDMRILRLNPYLVTHVVTKASDEPLNKALDGMGR